MKKTILTSVLLVVVGIIIGAIIVSNLSGTVDPGFARGGDVKLGGPTPIPQQNPSVKALGDNFVAVAKVVTPCVVAINVTTSGKELEERMPKDQFHNFGPDFKLPGTGTLPWIGVRCHHHSRWLHRDEQSCRRGR